MSNSNLQNIHSSVLQDSIALYETIEKGLAYSDFEDILNDDYFTTTDWADILGLTERTLLNYKKSRKAFREIQSDKIVAVKEVIQYGLEVFGDKQKLISWLNQSKPIFKGHSPKGLLSNSYGKEVVMAELNRIEHGIFA